MRFNSTHFILNSCSHIVLQNEISYIQSIPSVSIMFASFLCLFDEQPYGYPSINMDKLFHINTLIAEQKLVSLISFFLAAS